MSRGGSLQSLMLHIINTVTYWDTLYAIGSQRRSCHPEPAAAWESKRSALRQQTGAIAEILTPPRRGQKDILQR